MEHSAAFLTRSAVDSASQFWVGADVTRADLTAAVKSADTLIFLKAFRGKFAGAEPDPTDIDRLRNVAMVYEFAAAGALSTAMDNLGEPMNGRTDRVALRASAFIAYDMLRAIPDTDTSVYQRILNTLNLCSLGYLGDRGVDLYSVVKGAPATLIPTDWVQNILSVMYQCWVKLFCKRTTNDLVDILEAITTLRRLQTGNEAQYLNGAGGPDAKHIRAVRLISLYNWARATELLASYIRGGAASVDGREVDTLLDQFFGNARQSASLINDHLLEGLLWSLHAVAKRMTELSIWRVERIAPIAGLVRRLAEEAKPVFEFLPLQRDALLSAGVLDSAKTAVVIDMPTSAGKTLLAEFRIAQTLTANREVAAWAAYVVPTRALAAQILRRLRSDFAGQFRVEALSSAVDVDSLERDLLADRTAFDVLVCTPEKLSSIVRQKSVSRPLALVVMDEAQTIGDKSRGLHAELLLATLRADTQAEFMLIMPYVDNASELSLWLAPEGAGQSVSLSGTPWKPNDVLVGTFKIEPGESPRKWRLAFAPVIAPRTLQISETLELERVAPLSRPFSAVRNTGYLAAASMAIALDDRDNGLNLVMCSTLDSTWKAAEELRRELPPLEFSPRRELIRRFVETEVSPGFALGPLLSAGIAVHHAGLPDEVRTLVELLAEEGQLRAICATPTIAQGMNFNVASVFLSTLSVPDAYSRPMETREFWNVAGRAGRVGQSSIGVVGVFANQFNARRLQQILEDHARRLDSQLEELVKKLDEADLLGSLNTIRFSNDWAEFRSYVAHMCAQIAHPSTTQVEQLVRNTFGYRKLSASDDQNLRRKAQLLVQTTRQYAAELTSKRGLAVLSDGTGFSPDAVDHVRQALQLNHFGPEDWRSESLFSGHNTSALPKIIGAMMHVSQIRDALKDLGGEGDASSRIADITAAWVQGRSIESIATEFFPNERAGELNLTVSVTKACKAIYRALTFAAPWGLSGVMQIPNSGIDFEKLTDADRHVLNLLPAFIYHGVHSESAVALRMNGVPRSIAQNLATAFDSESRESKSLIGSAKLFLRELSVEGWELARPETARISGAEYREIWQSLAPT